ncbi:hypothetical protein [Haloarchaeobius sp. DFWS5]
MMTLGDKVLAVAAIAVIDVSFVYFEPWLGALALVASIPLLVAVLLR